jgi:uncharacterized membrane protein YoaK (UPF0700 family)
MYSVGEKTRNIDLRLVALAAAAGCLDTTTYLRAHVFVANMTGNTVLFGLGVAAGNGGTIALTISTVVAFIAGSFVGTAIAAGSRTAARTVLLLEAGILAAVAALWLRVPAEPAAFGAIAFAGASFVMGMQQTATEQLKPQSHVSTTYMSGTVERIGSGLYNLFARKPTQFTANTVIWLAFLLASFAVGKISGTSILTFAPCAMVAAVALRTSGQMPRQKETPDSRGLARESGV